MTVIQKHSRVPRKANPEGTVAVKRTYTVAKRPLSDLTADERTRIAHEVLDGYIRGDQVANMSKSYGVSDVTIYALLLREHEQDWVDIQKARALARYERALNDVEEAPDALSLARTRETLRSAQWELERLLKRLYGQELNVNVEVNLGLGDRLRRARDRVIEPLAVVVEQPAQLGVDCERN